MFTFFTTSFKFISDHFWELPITFENQLQQNSILKFSNNKNSRISLCFRFGLPFDFNPLNIHNISFVKLIHPFIGLDLIPIIIIIVIVIIRIVTPRPLLKCFIWSCDSLYTYERLCLSPANMLCFWFSTSSFKFKQICLDGHTYTTSLHVFVRPSNRNYHHRRSYSVSMHSVCIIFFLICFHLF